VPNISQSSVATHSRCGGIFNNDLVAEPDSESSLKIIQHLASRMREQIGNFLDSKWPMVHIFVPSYITIQSGE